MMTMRTLLLTGLVAAVPSGVFAAETQSSLPGVGTDYSLVKPEADQPEALVADEDGFVMVGGVRIKVSGMIRYDVDFATENKKAPRLPHQN